MATVDKNFKVKNGLIVGDSTNLVNYTSASPTDNFIGQFWIDDSDTLYAWSGSAWVSVGGGGGGSASGTPFNISNTLVARSASGTFSIGAVDFDTTASSALSVGRMQWNQNFGTPEVGLIGGNVTANIGQHVHAYVTNDEASSLVAGDVVYLFGATGDRASVKKAYNLSDTTSSKTFGVVAETIAAGQTGFVTVFGVVDKLDLSLYNPGDVLWLSASPGKFTSIKPSAPQHLVFVGVVEKTNAGNGQLFVNIQNGYELEELHSVSINNLTDNDILSYNGSSSLWFNQSLATAIQEIDGPGSGINADLLDGQHASDFLLVSASAGLEEVTYSANPPTSPPVGYIWIESDVDVSTQTYHAAYSASAPVSAILGDLWVDSSIDSDVFQPTLMTRWYQTLSSSAISFSGISNGKLLNYKTGYEEVYLNGILLVRDLDYTANDDATVTLTASALPGDIVEVHSVSTINLVDTYTQAQVDALLNTYLLSSTASSVYLRQDTASAAYALSTSLSNLEIMSIMGAL